MQFFEPENAADLAAKILDLVHDSGKYNALRERDGIHSTEQLGREEE